MSGVKVLVVESEPWLGAQFERVLAKHEFDVAVTSNAYSAMDMVDDFQPAVIVMGLLLSGAGGLGLLHELQSYPDTADIPVVVCAGNPAAAMADELRPYGVAKVVDTNTMRPDDLVLAVRSALA